MLETFHPPLLREIYCCSCSVSLTYEVLFHLAEYHF